MTFPELDYIRWAKALPRVAMNLARSGIEACPPSLLGIRRRRMWCRAAGADTASRPLREAIARRYGVAPRRFTVSGGTSFANWLASPRRSTDAARATK